MSKGENTFYSTHTFLYPLEFAGFEIPRFSDDWEEENRWQELKKSDRPLLASDVKGFGKSDLDDYREEMNRVLLWNTYRYFLPAVQNQLFPKPESSGKSGGEKCRIRHFRYRNLTGYHNDIWKALNGRADEKERKKLQDYCFKKLENCSQYQIETGSGEVFLLRLTGIRLSYLEKYKMGILGFETVYLGEKKVGEKSRTARTCTPTPRQSMIWDGGSTPPATMPPERVRCSPPPRRFGSSCPDKKSCPIKKRKSIKQS